MLLLLRIFFLLDLVLQLLLKLLLLSRRTHGHAARLKNPPSATHGEGAHDCTPIAGLHLLLLYFPASAGILPSLRAATPPPLESSDGGMVQHSSMLHRRWAANDALRTLLVPRLRCWSSSQPAHREQGPAPISSTMKLHRSLL